MLIVEKGEVYGFEAAVRGARNPMDSWAKSDSYYDEMGNYVIGPVDLDFITRLSNGKSDDRKFLRQIPVSVDITAPLYWWKEMDQYKVGTVTDSCSTMHKISSKPFDQSQFSCEHLTQNSKDLALTPTIDALNFNREQYLATKDKDYWWQMIQLLPSSYNQKRTWTGNYEVLRNIYHARKNHKLDEWHVFCDWIRELPYATELITKEAIS